MNKMFVLYFALLHEEQNIYFLFALRHEQNVCFIFCSSSKWKRNNKKKSNIYKFMFKYVERRKFTECAIMPTKTRLKHSHQVIATNMSLDLVSRQQLKDLRQIYEKTDWSVIRKQILAKPHKFSTSQEHWRSQRYGSAQAEKISRKCKKLFSIFGREKFYVKAANRVAVAKYK
jgi:hypothetical protein